MQNPTRDAITPRPTLNPSAPAPANALSVPAPSRPPLSAWVAMGVAMLAISSGSIFVRYAEAPALAKAAWRMGLAAAAVLPFALLHRRPELRGLTRAQWLQAALSGAFLAFHFSTWIASLDSASVAASTLLVNTAPVWVALLTPWITGDRLRLRGWFGVGLGFVGAALAVGRIDLSSRACAGNLLALTGGLLLAFYLMMGRRLRRQLSLLTYVSVTYSIAAAILWAMVAATATRAWGFSAVTWAALAGMGVFGQHLGHSAYNYALRYLSPGVLSVLLLSEPILASLAAWFCFGEVPTARLALSAALLIPGIWLVARDRP